VANGFASKHLKNGRFRQTSQKSISFNLIYTLIITKWCKNGRMAGGPAYKICKEA